LLPDKDTKLLSTSQLWCSCW